MFKNYVKVAVRSYKNHPLFSTLNIIGLAVGICCFLLISLYVWDELQFDRHFSDSDRIYRVIQKTVDGGTDIVSATTVWPMREALYNDMSAQIEKVARIFDFRVPKASIGSREKREFFKHDKFFFADPEVIDLFDVNLIQGDPETALNNPGSVIVTERVAKLYFGDENPIGKELNFQGFTVLTITGVMEEWDRQSHFKAELIASFESIRDIYRNYDVFNDNWVQNTVWVYVKLKQGASPEAVNEQLLGYHDTYFARDYSGDQQITVSLQPLEDIWLKSGLEEEVEPVSDFTTIILFGVVAILIIVIACINFINLATARAVRRAREVGLRKTIGAHKGQLVTQFLIESLIKTVIAVAVGVLFLFLVAPVFNAFTGKELYISEMNTVWMLLLLTGFTLLITLAAGLYPSFVLSAYEPAETIRSSKPKGKGGIQIRKLLVVFQFSITSLLIIGTGLTYFQYKYMTSKDLGFEKEQVLLLPTNMTLAIWKYDELKERLLSHSGILEVAGVQIEPGGEDVLRYQYSPEGYSLDDALLIPKIYVTEDFIETLNIDVIAGRPFSKDFETDKGSALMINRALVERLDWGEPEDAIGKFFRWEEEEPISVIGVVENFHFNHLYNEMEPLILRLPQTFNRFVANTRYILVKLSPGNPEAAIQYADEVWSDLDNINPFEYRFLDERLNELYKTEETMNSLITIFAFLALLIGCLGLLGLASYMVQNREKEVGIRKVLGASSSQLFLLLTKDFMKLILIAHIITLPVAYYLKNVWFQSFAYQIDSGFYLAITFTGSILLSICLCIITIGYQSFRVATQNPVNSINK